MKKLILPICFLFFTYNFGFSQVNGSQKVTCLNFSVDDEAADEAKGLIVDYADHVEGSNGGLALQALGAIQDYLMLIDIATTNWETTESAAAFSGNNVEVAPNFEVSESGTHGKYGYDNPPPGSGSFGYSVEHCLPGNLQNYSLDGVDVSSQDAIQNYPIYQSSANNDIIRFSGGGQIYMISNDENNIKYVAHEVFFQYSDIVEVYSPVPIAIKIPISVGGNATAYQSFAHPERSFCESICLVKATINGAEAYAGGNAFVNGAFLANAPLFDHQGAYINAPAGVSIYNLDVTIKVKLKSSLSAASQYLPCASNVSGSCNVTVGNFTTLGNLPLPPECTIIGSTTGVNYTNPDDPFACTGIPTPEIVIVNDSCGLGLGSLTILNPIDSINYEWNTGSGDSTITGLTAGNYFCNLSDTSGCVRYFPIEVIDPEQPEIILPEIVDLEAGESVEIAATIENDPALSYLWSTGESTASIEVTDFGTYTVSITNENGCEYIAEVLVQESSLIEYPCLTANYLFSNNAQDISGNDNHAIVNGASLTLDRNAKENAAFSFDGTDDFLEIPNTQYSQPMGGLSIYGWFKTDKSEFNPIISNSGYELYLENGKIHTNINTLSGESIRMQSKFEYDDDVWHFITMTYDAATGIARLLMDGRLITENFNANTADSINYSDPIACFIGSDVEQNNFFKGTIDDIKIFQCPINEEELLYISKTEPATDICQTLFYAEDFEEEAGPEWLNQYYISYLGTQTLGRYHHQKTELVLQDIPPHSVVQICFDLYLNDSWDGNTTPFGPDPFTITESGRVVMRTSFANNYGGSVQTYPSEYMPEFLSNNQHLTGADLIGAWSPHYPQYADSKYEICRSFVNQQDSLHFIFEASLEGNNGINDESFCLDNFQIFLERPSLTLAEEIINCNSDGSYNVIIPFETNANNTDYMVYDLGDLYNELDTVYFTDDGTISEIEFGTYLAGRDYKIVIAEAGDFSNCYPIISDTTTCFFNEVCAIDVATEEICVGDSLHITGIISGGTGPFAISCGIYANVILLGEDPNLDFKIPYCSFDNLEMIITDINLCQVVKTYEATDLPECVVIETPTITMNGNVLTASSSNYNYQWIDCDTNVPISGATDPNYTIEASGNYAVQIINENCNVISECLYSVGIEDVSETFFTVSPNPVSSTFNIQTDADILNIELWDVNGKVFKPLSSTDKEINIVDLPSGVYILHVDLSSEKISTRILKF